MESVNLIVNQVSLPEAKVVHFRSLWVTRLVVETGCSRLQVAGEDLASLAGRRKKKVRGA